MTTPTPGPEPPPSGGMLGWLSAVKGLTITNALVIIMLAVVAIPGYVIYRAINSPDLIDRFFSNYREISAQNVGCSLRATRLRGSSELWTISTGFAYQGSDRWLVSVVLDHQPAGDELQSYCATLTLIVDFMRDPEAHSPSFPGTHEPVVRQYAREREKE